MTDHNFTRSTTFSPCSPFSMGATLAASRLQQRQALMGALSPWLCSTGLGYKYPPVYSTGLLLSAGSSGAREVSGEEGAVAPIPIFLRRV